MSQRTRSHMTGDAVPTAPEAPKASKPRSTKGRQTRAQGQQTRAQAPAAQPASATSTPASAPTPAPEALARTLRAVAAELERDPDLAHRITQAIEAAQAASDVDDPASPPPFGRAPAEPSGGARQVLSAGEGAITSRAFTPRLVTGAGPELGTGIPDPFALRAHLGEDGLRAALAALRLGTLRAIVREHRLVLSGRLTHQNDAEKLRAAILAAVENGNESSTP